MAVQAIGQGIADDLLSNSKIRREIVRELTASSEGEISASLAGRLLRQGIPRMSYHLKLLADGGILVVSREERVRGAVAVYYSFSEAYLNRAPDGPTLDTLAEYLQQCTRVADLGKLRAMVGQTGRSVVALPAPEPDPDPVATAIASAQGDFSIDPDDGRGA